MMLRGINRQDIFEDDEDYRMFIRILSGIVAREGHGEGHEGHGDRHLTLSRSCPHDPHTTYDSPLSYLCLLSDAEPCSLITEGK